jgi:phage terminase large subunit
MTVVAIDRAVPRWALPLHRPARYKGASGGRGSGKSHEFAAMLVEAAVCKPSLRGVCIREVQRSLKFSAKSLIEQKIRSLGVSKHFAILDTEIRRVGGSGVLIFEGMQDHTADSIKSLEGFEIAWVEEAQSLSQKSLDLLIPTIRAPGSELWFTWNPKLKTDAVDVLFASKPEGAVHVHTTYRDNPWVTDELRNEAERLKREDPDRYDHVWGGKYDLGGKGRVYAKFLEKPFPEGNIDDSVRDLGGEILVGQDFNVNPMASVLACRAVDECHVFDAMNIETSNTEEVCTEIAQRFPGRRVIFCPDPAGNQRHTNAKVGTTDFTIIRSFGFEVRAPRSHPPVVDRINNTNQMLEHAGRRRVRVHSRAKHLIEALNGLKYKDGTNLPDKRSGFDHQGDALGYLLWQEFNVVTPAQSWGQSTFST